MFNYNAIIFCLSYVLGIVIVAAFSPAYSEIPLKLSIILTVVVGIFSIIIALIVPRFWKTGPPKKVWIIAGIIAILAMCYFQLRLPRIEPNTLDQLSLKSGTMVQVEGIIKNEPRLTRKQKVKFVLAAKNIDQIPQNSLKLYVTVPLLQGTGLYPQQKLTINGILYQPKNQANPGSFDFKSYLARDGIFFGLSGTEVMISPDNIEPFFSLYKLRQRILRSQLYWVGSPFGQLITSMVLGSRAVDLPWDIQDLFLKTGLAHALAASGFQVSLLLGVTIFFSKNLSTKIQFIVGTSILLIYLTLTGFEASIMRAVVMGIGALLGIVTERRVKIFGSLLLSAVILLIINPVWLTELGFQLSFLATLGLVITTPAIEKKLDWLPPTISGLIAVPLAASLWTLPLTIYVFNTIAIYSIVVNIITSPLIALISLGGMISAFLALIYPVLGSALAWLLYYPTYCLLTIVEFFANLPGSYLSIGKISLSVLLIIYFIYGVVLINNWWQRRWLIVFLFILSIVLIPIWYRQVNLVQITVLANSKEPIIVMQNKGKTALLGSGETEDIDYVILPFLREQGINNVEYAIALNPQQKYLWDNLANIISVKEIYRDLNVNQEIVLRESKISLINNQSSILNINISGDNWLVLNDKYRENREQIELGNFSEENRQNLTLIWSGKTLKPEWLEMLKPQVAIACSNSLEQNLQQELKRRKIELYWTGRDGAVQWILGKGFSSYLEGPFPG